MTCLQCNTPNECRASNACAIHCAQQAQYAQNAQQLGAQQLGQYASHQIDSEDSQWKSYMQKYMSDLHIRVLQLEKLVQYPNSLPVKEAAVKAQAEEHLYAPLRSDTAALLALADFAREIAAAPYYAYGWKDKAQEILEKYSK